MAKKMHAAKHEAKHEKKADVKPVGVADDKELNGPMPDELRGWNWGAFLLTLIWGISHNVWIALLALIPYVGIVMAFVLGFKGNEWAWKNRKFASVEEFRAVQREWAKWGLIVLLALILILVISFGMTVKYANIEMSTSTEIQVSPTAETTQ